MEIKPIAIMHTDLPDKFGIPRQSGLATALMGRIVFEKEYRDPDALRGLEEYDYLWLLWEFEGIPREEFRPLVRPPRLGGNTYMGVFATRSPFRPNPIGLSCVKLERIEHTQSEGPVIVVSGIDLRDKTPIFDIKPYLPYVDAKAEARGGFTDRTKAYNLVVEVEDEMLASIPEEKREGLLQLLSQDPRPSYQDDPERVYGLTYFHRNISFSVKDGILKVIKVEEDYSGE